MFFDPVERFEITPGTKPSHRHAEAYGKLGYNDHPGSSSPDKVKLNENFRKQYTFVNHFSGSTRGRVFACRDDSCPI